MVRSLPLRHGSPRTTAQRRQECALRCHRRAPSTERLFVRTHAGAGLPIPHFSRIPPSVAQPQAASRHVQQRNECCPLPTPQEDAFQGGDQGDEDRHFRLRHHPHHHPRLRQSQHHAPHAICAHRRPRGTLHAGELWSDIWKVFPQFCMVKQTQSGADLLQRRGTRHLSRG